MIKNEYKVTSITISGEAKCFCPLGQDWYTNRFTMELQPDEVIPDYCEIDRYIDENINGKHYIIEEAVKILYEYLASTYAPDFLRVSSSVTDATHCAVVVAREGNCTGWN